MKVETIRNNASVSKISSSRKSKGNGAFQDLLEIGNEQIEGPSHLSEIPSFLYLEHGSTQDDEATEYAGKMMDLMINIRDSMIDRRISKHDLMELEGLIGQAKKYFVNPELEEVIKEVETRAAVEIAKLNMLQDSIS